MEREGYLKRSWNSMTAEKGWIEQILILAVIQLIPVFGQIVALGWFYNWAKDAAWGVDSKLPKGGFFNEKTLKTGVMAWGIIIIWSLVGNLAYSILSYPISAIGNLPIMGSFLSFLLDLAVFVALALWGFLAIVAAMRSAIYDSFSPVVQVKQAWMMFRHDWKGAVRVFLISLLVLIPLMAVTLIFAIIIAMSMGGSLVQLFMMAANGQSIDAASQSLAMDIVGILPMLIIVSLVLFYAMMVCDMITSGLTYRALGLWTAGFDVPRWRGQNDPLPFQTQQTPPPSAAPVQPYQAAPSQQPAPQGQPAPQEAPVAVPVAPEEAPTAVPDAVEAEAATAAEAEPADKKPAARKTSTKKATPKADEASADEEKPSDGE